MNGLPSTVTNKFIFRIPFPGKISCHVPEKNVAESVTNFNLSPYPNIQQYTLFGRYHVRLRHRIGMYFAVPIPFFFFNFL